MRKTFQIFAQPSAYPIFYHCRIGTDRTGYTTYLLLGLLGAYEEDIYRDYLRSNWCLRRKNRILKFLLFIAPIGLKFKKFLLGFLRVKKEYLKSVIDEAKAEFGSIVGYCKSALGVTEEQIENLRNKYLTY